MSQVQTWPQRPSLACTAVGRDVSDGRTDVAARAGVRYASRSADFSTLPGPVTGSASSTCTTDGTWVHCQLNTISALS